MLFAPIVEVQSVYKKKTKKEEMRRSGFKKR
jgi:hypothetical protein